MCDFVQNIRKYCFFPLLCYLSLFFDQFQYLNLERLAGESKIKLISLTTANIVCNLQMQASKGLYYNYFFKYIFLRK